MPYKIKEKSNDYQRQYRKNNPEKIRSWESKRQNNKRKDYIRTWQKKRYAWFKKKILEIKLTQNHCIICSYSIHPEILQFHHRNKEAKSFVLSGGNVGNRSWSKILKEIQKCDLICPNCHMWKHLQERE